LQREAELALHLRQASFNNQQRYRLCKGKPKELPFALRRLISNYTHIVLNKRRGLSQKLTLRQPHIFLRSFFMQWFVEIQKKSSIPTIT
jgi:hypothetical protein